MLLQRKRNFREFLDTSEKTTFELRWSADFDFNSLKQLLAKLWEKELNKGREVVRVGKTKVFISLMKENVGSVAVDGSITIYGKADFMYGNARNSSPTISNLFILNLEEYEGKNNTNFLSNGFLDFLNQKLRKTEMRMKSRGTIVYFR